MAYREVSEIQPRKFKPLPITSNGSVDSSEHSEHDTTRSNSFKPVLERTLLNRVIMDQQQQQYMYDPNNAQNGGQGQYMMSPQGGQMPHYPMPPQFEGQPYMPPESDEDEEYDEERLMQVSLLKFCFDFFVLTF